jgi:hypothetical protein
MAEVEWNVDRFMWLATLPRLFILVDEATLRGADLTGFEALRVAVATRLCVAETFLLWVAAATRL